MEDLEFKRGANEARPYKPNDKKVMQLLFAGFVGTAVMTFVAYLLRIAGVPSPSFPALFGAIINGQNIPYAFTFAWIVGLTWHFINGSLIFPFVGDYLADRKVLPQRKWIKGIVFGIIVWLFHELLVVPAAGLGIFWNVLDSNAIVSLCSFLAFVIYGAALDGVERVRAVHEFRVMERQAA